MPSRYDGPGQPERAQTAVGLEDARACLVPLVVAVIRLYERLHAVLLVPPVELGVANRELKDFYEELVGIVLNFAFSSSS